MKMNELHLNRKIRIAHILNKRYTDRKIIIDNNLISFYKAFKNR